MKYLAVVLLSCFMFVLFADNIDYAVADWGGAEVRRAGDGTIFLNYNYQYADQLFLNADAYGFTLYLFVERGGAIAQFPTPAVPIQVRKLSGQDISHWFTITPSSAIFTGYGSDPDSLGLPPHGLYVTTRVTFVIKPESLTERITQVKIQANTAGIPNIGNGHGIIVRLIREGTTPNFDVTSWITDSNFVPIDTFLVVKRSCNCCRCRNCGYCRCGCSRSWVNPTTLWYNVFVTNYDVALPDLFTSINPIPTDFVAVPYNSNATYVWLVPVNVTNPDFNQAIPNGFDLTYGPTRIEPQGTEFMIHHFKYDLGVAPVDSLPRTYTFSATAAAAGITLYTDDIITGKKVTQNCNGCCRCGGGGGCSNEDQDFFSARVMPTAFSRQTGATVRMTLPHAEKVLIRIYSADGRETSTLVSGNLPKGVHDFRVGYKLASGVYFCRIETSEHHSNLKLVVTD